MHLALEAGEIPIGHFMQHLASRYARAVQRRVPTTGHLFERRYRALLVDTDAYLLALIRYIHLNPVRAGMVADPSDYRWSGHRAYLGVTQVPWLSTSLGLSLFGNDEPGRHAAYRRFVMAEPDPEEIDRMRGGSPEDPRILGPIPGRRPVVPEPPSAPTDAAS